MLSQFMFSSLNLIPPLLLIRFRRIRAALEYPYFTSLQSRDNIISYYIYLFFRRKCKYYSKRQFMHEIVISSQ
jgi:hypothetical protein